MTICAKIHELSEKYLKLDEYFNTSNDNDETKKLNKEYSLTKLFIELLHETSIDAIKNFKDVEHKVEAQYKELYAQKIAGIITQEEFNNAYAKIQEYQLTD